MTSPHPMYTKWQRFKPINHIFTTEWKINIPNNKKRKVLPYLLPSVGHGADPGVQEVSPQVTFKSSSAVGCYYFPPGLRSPSQPKNVTFLRPVPSYTAWWQRHKVWATCSRLLRSFVPVGIEPTTYWSQVQRLNVSSLLDVSYSGALQTLRWLIDWLITAKLPHHLCSRLEESKYQKVKQIGNMSAM